MSILKSIARKFVEMDDNVDKALPPTPVSTPQPSTTSTTVPIISPASALDLTIVDTLTKVITGRKTSYTALIDTAAKLVAVIPDETMRIKAAFTMVTSDGNRTIDSINQGIDIHLSDLAGESLRIKQASDTSNTTKVKSLRQSALQLSEENESNLRKISEFNQQITELESRRTENQNKIYELEKQANTAETEIKTINMKFEAALDYHKQDLLAKKQYFATLLKN